jgi:hypothetical protein
MLTQNFRVGACSQLQADIENAETQYRIGRESVDFALNELKRKLRELEKEVCFGIVSMYAGTLIFK